MVEEHRIEYSDNYLRSRLKDWGSRKPPSIEVKSMSTSIKGRSQALMEHMSSPCVIIRTFDKCLRISGKFISWRPKGETPISFPKNLDDQWHFSIIEYHWICWIESYIYKQSIWHQFEGFFYSLIKIMLFSSLYQFHLTWAPSVGKPLVYPTARSNVKQWRR